MEVELDPQQGEHAERDDHVVRQRRDGADRELPLEAEPDIDQHHRQRDDQCRDAVGEQLFRDFRADGVVAQEVAILDAEAELFGQRPDDQLIGRAAGAFGLLFRGERLEILAQQVRRRFAELDDDNLAIVRAARTVDFRIDRHGGTDGRHGDRVGLGQFDHGAAGEVDAEIEAALRQHEGRQRNHQHGEDCPCKAQAHEADVGLLGPVSDQHVVSPGA